MKNWISVANVCYVFVRTGHNFMRCDVVVVGGGGGGSRISFLLRLFIGDAKANFSGWLESFLAGAAGI